MRYLPHTDDEVASMLKAVGRADISELFASIPADLQLDGPLELPEPLDEGSLLAHLESLSARTSGRPFLGGGCYPHHVPETVSQLLLRGELLTAYTPYQPECSQGTLQIIFEFQTMVCALTGLGVANASMYDGAHATTEAALMALRVRRKTTRVLVSRALHPDYRAVLETYLRHGSATVEEIDFDSSGAIDLDALDAALGEDVAAVIVGYPNFFGVIEPVDEVSKRAAATGALTIASTQEAVALGLLAGPGELGADVAVGELGSFGNSMSLGGPSVGFFAAKEQFLRQIPGRLCGATVDREGRRGFVLTLSTREQHIRREKATSNICTNQGLCATAATIHLSLLGRHGVRELGRLNWLRARYARTRLRELGVSLKFTGPTFNEFVVDVDDADAALRRLRKAGVEGGLRLARFYDDDALKNSLAFAVTEVHDRESIDALCDALGGRA